MAGDIVQLLDNWENVYKKGLLTFWLLLLLSQEPHYPYEMADAVERISQGTVSADGNSIYRAVGRFEAMGIVTGQLQKSDSGPSRKYYHLTKMGQELLGRFIERNILLFSNPQVADWINNVLQNGGKHGS